MHQGVTIILGGLSYTLSNLVDANKWLTLENEVLFLFMAIWNDPCSMAGGHVIRLLGLLVIWMDAVYVDVAENLAPIISWMQRGDVVCKDEVKELAQNKCRSYGWGWGTSSK